MGWGGLGQLAEPGGFVDWRTDDGVLETLLGADVPGDRLTGSHADARLAFRHLFSDPAGDGASCRKGFVLGVLDAVRGAEYRQRRVALELVDEAVVAVDLVDDHREEPGQPVDHFGGGAARPQPPGVHGVPE